MDGWNTLTVHTGSRLTLSVKLAPFSQLNLLNNSRLYIAKVFTKQQNLPLVNVLFIHLA